jgi:hypothetical protein
MRWMLNWFCTVRVVPYSGWNLFEGWNLLGSKTFCNLYPVLDHRCHIDGHENCCFVLLHCVPSVLWYSWLLWEITLTMHVRMVVSRFREALLSASEVLAVFLELFCGMLIFFPFCSKVWENMEDDIALGKVTPNIFVQCALLDIFAMCGCLVWWE